MNKNVLIGLVAFVMSVGVGALGKPPRRARKPPQPPVEAEVQEGANEDPGDAAKEPSETPEESDDAGVASKESPLTVEFVSYRLIEDEYFPTSLSHLFGKNLNEKIRQMESLPPEEYSQLMQAASSLRSGEFCKSDADPGAKKATDEDDGSTDNGTRIALSDEEMTAQMQDYAKEYPMDFLVAKDFLPKLQNIWDKRKTKCGPMETWFKAHPVDFIKAASYAAMAEEMKNRAEDTSAWSATMEEYVPNYGEVVSQFIRQCSVSAAVALAKGKDTEHKADEKSYQETKASLDKSENWFDVRNHFVSIEISNNGRRTISGVQITASLDGYSTPAVDTVDIRPGKSAKVKLTPAFTRKLLRVAEQTRANVSIKVSAPGIGVVYNKTRAVTLLSRNEMVWSVKDLWDNAFGIVSFVTPHDSRKSIDLLLSAAAEKMPGRSLGGYMELIQGASHQDITSIQASAIYAAIQEKGIHYVNTPISFDNHAQRIKFPSETLADQSGNYGAPKNSDSFLRWISGPQNRKMTRWGFVDEGTTRPSSRLA